MGRQRWGRIHLEQLKTDDPKDCKVEEGKEADDPEPRQRPDEGHKDGVELLEPGEDPHDPQEPQYPHEAVVPNRAELQIANANDEKVELVPGVSKVAEQRDQSQPWSQPL